MPTDSGIVWCCTGNDFLFSFNFSSAFTAAAGAKYHLGIHTGAPGNFSLGNIYWVTTLFNLTITGRASHFGRFHNWTQTGAEHAFFLIGGDNVPEPDRWAMMIAGFGLVGAAMRRRSVAVAA